MQEITVTNAFWNGKEFNGQPFSDNPPWVEGVLKAGLMGIIPKGKNDTRKHAIWAVKTKEGIMVAEPGDKLAVDPLFGIVVTKSRQNTLTWEDINPTKKAQPEPAAVKTTRKRVVKKKPLAKKPAARNARRKVASKKKVK